MVTSSDRTWLRLYIPQQIFITYKTRNWKFTIRSINCVRSVKNAYREKLIYVFSQLMPMALISVEDILTVLNTKSSVNRLGLLVTLFCHHLLGVHESPLLVGRIILIVEKV